MALVLAVLLALALAGPAHAASTVSTDVFGMDYDGDAGVNTPTFTDAAAPVAGDTRVTVEEPGVVAGMGCTQMGANAAYCDIGDTDDVTANLGEGNDVATSNGTRLGYRFAGQGGDDTLTGADAEQGPFVFTIFDSLDGGEGTDTLTGRGGDDSLDGGAGDGDVADGGEGDDSFTFSEQNGSGDVYRGGPGFDEVFIFWFGPDPPLGGTVDLAAGTAAVAGLSSAQLEGIEDADGTDGDDVLLGTAGANHISGDEGNDTIDGREGADRLEGDEGDDRLEGRDRFFDQLIGGLGTDTCDADQLDSRVTCEAGALVELPPFGTPPAPDRAAPGCTASGAPRRAPARRVRRRGVRVVAVCDEAGRIAVRLLVRLRRVPGGATAAAAGDVELASRSRTVSAGEPRTVRLRVARRLRPLVRKGARVRLEILATDAAGNEGVTTRRVRIR